MFRPRFLEASFRCSGSVYFLDNDSDIFTRQSFLYRSRNQVNEEVFLLQNVEGQ